MATLTTNVSNLAAFQADLDTIDATGNGLVSALNGLDSSYGSFFSGSLSISSASPTQISGYFGGGGSFTIRGSGLQSATLAINYIGMFSGTGTDLELWGNIQASASSISGTTSSIRFASPMVSFQINGNLKVDAASPAENGTVSYLWISIPGAHPVVESLSGNLYLNADGTISGTVSAASLQVDSDFLTLTGLSVPASLFNVNDEGNSAATMLAGALAGADAVTGAQSGQTLYGFAGNDTLTAGNAGQTLLGGTGHDTYVLGGYASTTVTENAGEGTDTIETGIAWILPANVENLTLTGSTDIDGTGNALANVLTGNAGANRLLGLDGADKLNGGAGADTLDGGAGNDTMAGGAGDDQYRVDASGDAITEAAGGGRDTVFAGADFTLGANLEVLVLVAGATNGAGNDQANEITGNDGANSLSGGGGNDTLSGGGGTDTLAGGAGDDLYLLDGDGDVVQEAAGGGIDTVRAAFPVALAAHLENLELTGGDDLSGTGNDAANRLTGNDGANLLTAGAGNDTLDGGAGPDFLVGGSGDDSYVVDDANDIVVEEEGGGVDTVYSSVSIVVPDNVENVTLSGTASAILVGGHDNNRLTGGGGADTLEGGGGSDTLAGGSGNDTYLIEDGALVQEGGGGGTDTVVFDGRGGYQLGANIENLQLPEGSGGLAGAGAGDANTLTGNGAGNRLDGGAGNDTLYGLGGDDVLIGGTGDDLLDGGRGADRMEGGAGNDRYVVGNVLDLVIEGPGNGTDSVDVHLAAYALPENVENAVGDGHANTLVGNALANRLTGGGGADRFVFERAPVAGVWDTVTDFVSGEDSLVLAGGWTGYLGTDFLRAGPGVTAAAAATDRLIYDSSTGSLYYDPDGTGVQAAIRLAVLEGHPALQATDIQTG